MHNFFFSPLLWHYFHFSIIFSLVLFSLLRCFPSAGNLSEKNEKNGEEYLRIFFHTVVVTQMCDTSFHSVLHYYAQQKKRKLSREKKENMGIVLKCRNFFCRYTLFTRVLWIQCRTTEFHRASPWATFFRKNQEVVKWGEWELESGRRRLRKKETTTDQKKKEWFDAKKIQEHGLLYHCCVGGSSINSVFSGVAQDAFYISSLTSLARFPSQTRLLSPKIKWPCKLPSNKFIMRVVSSCLHHPEESEIEINSAHKMELHALHYN